MARGFDDILSGIKGHAARMRRELPAGDPRLPDVDEILAGADRGSTLTRGLLAFGRGPPAPEPTDVADVVRRMEPFLRSLVREDVEVRTSLPGEPLCALVAPLQVEQVLVNLVTNARDAMPCGGRLTLSVARADLDAEAPHRAGLGEPGAYVRVAVADTGAGIPPEVRPRIFEPFFTTKSADHGTGLGLAVAYAVLKQHRGAMGVESEPGKGAAFTFLLPLLPAEAEPAAQGEPSAPAAAPAREDRTRRSRAAGATRGDA